MFDEARGVFLFYGGTNPQSEKVDELWEWDGSWTQASTPAPGARAAHSLTWDAARQRSVVIGGQHADQCPGTLNTFCDDIWEWDGTTWVQAEVIDPSADGSMPASFGHIAVYVEADGRIWIPVLDAGSTTAEDRSYFWRWDSGHAAMPGHHATVVLSETGGLDELEIQSVQARWAAGGVGYPGGSASYGAGLRLWSGTGWREVATDAGASPSAPGILSWCAHRPGTTAPEPTCSEESEMRSWLMDSAGELHVAATPLHPNGEGQGEFISDYVEVTVRYRLP